MICFFEANDERRIFKLLVPTLLLARLLWTRQEMHGMAKLHLSGREIT